jgi:hypothetical protein
MGLARWLNNMSTPSVVNREYIPCGETCGKCGRGECSDSLGHTQGSGHHSRSGEKRCGHTWGAESLGWGPLI